MITKKVVGLGLNPKGLVPVTGSATDVIGLSPTLGLEAETGDIDTPEGTTEGAADQEIEIETEREAMKGATEEGLTQEKMRMLTRSPPDKHPKKEEQ